MPIHRQDFQLLQPLVKMNKVLPGDQVIGTPIALTILQRAWYNSRFSAWMASAHLDLAHHSTHVVLDLGCTRSSGSRKTIRRFQTDALYCGMTTGFCPCSKSFVFANSEGETCRENCLVHFPTTPPCSTIVDVLETGDVPILFSLLQMQNLGITLELDHRVRDRFARRNM